MEPNVINRRARPRVQRCLNLPWHFLLWSQMNGPDSKNLVPGGIKDASSTPIFPCSAITSLFFFFFLVMVLVHQQGPTEQYNIDKCASFTSLDNKRAVGLTLFPWGSYCLLSYPFPCQSGEFPKFWCCLLKILFMCEVLINCYYSVISFKMFYHVLNAYQSCNCHIFLFTRCNLSMRLVYLNKE